MDRQKGDVSVPLKIMQDVVKRWKATVPNPGTIYAISRENHIQPY